MSIYGQSIRFGDVVPSALGLMLLGMFIAIFYQPWSWFGGLGWLALPLGAVLGGGVYLLMFSVSASPLLRVNSIQSLLSMLHNLFKNFTWTQIIIVSLLAGVGEEILIRGGLQSILISLTSPIVGMLLASLIFGAMHFISKIYVLITFIIGFVFALAFYLTDSMLLVMVAHTVYDIFAFAMIVKFPHMLGLESQNEQISIVDEADC
jgi:membrane protease YdiL (CAAX protease family)